MSLIDPTTLYLPDLPGHLDGLTIVHLSDFHIRKSRTRHRRIVDEVAGLRPDLYFLTGDYITTYGDEPAAMRVMGEVCESLIAKHGVFGVFGNHDSLDFKERARELPVCWLDNGACVIDEIEVEVFGFATDEATFPDSVATLASRANGDGGCSAGVGVGGAGGLVGERALRLLLCHYPTYLPTASDLGVDVMFSGHTHGGQCRLPWGWAPANSTDLPPRLTSGVLRHRDTCCVVSRGLGENILPFRVFCPPHIPLYTLRRGRMVGERSDHVVNAVPW